MNSCRAWFKPIELAKSFFLARIVQHHLRGLRDFHTSRLLTEDHIEGESFLVGDSHLLLVAMLRNSEKATRKVPSCYRWQNGLHAKDVPRAKGDSPELGWAVGHKSSNAE